MFSPLPLLLSQYNENETLTQLNIILNFYTVRIIRNIDILIPKCMYKFNSRAYQDIILHFIAFFCQKYQKLKIKIFSFFLIFQY